MTAPGRPAAPPLIQPAEKLQLPASPNPVSAGVQAWEEPVNMFTFLPGRPDPNPMFLQKRVYQGSNGEVYPLPFIDRVATTGAHRRWKAVHIENRYLRLMILPEIGGRIHVGLDKTNGYDFFYRQNVIKPALVGLAGPWISGGVEFNWPQHHRPGTFMPVDTQIERHPDGSATVWCSDYDRATGMKGMHGVCLHPERAVVELKVRLYNATERVQTFLWWANVAVRVHENYQSFFPLDVRHVADHAKRAVSSFPLADATYYGVDYGSRVRNGVPGNELPANFRPSGYPPNDLSRYANIPVPTSYMVVQTREDFFGGYDHDAQAGFVHVANHHIAPGKKQWTWGNHDFGYAWDRCLTENDGPYVELMAGVYTDNQPDFSFLAPAETKTFSQFWYPLRDTGVPVAANLDAAVGLRVEAGVARIAICVTRDLPSASIVLKSSGEVLARWDQALPVSAPFSERIALAAHIDPNSLQMELRTPAGSIITASLRPKETGPAPSLAEEPAAPHNIVSTDQLFLTGLHLEQYRHATRSPEPYWREGLRRDPGDTRCNHALGKLHLSRGEYDLAEAHFRAAIQRSTQLNPNPYDGEVFYSLALTLRRQHRLDEAYAAFYKATWDAAWRSAGYHALAQIDAVRGELESCLDHLKLSLRTNTDNLNARNLCVAVMRQLGLNDASAVMLKQTRAMDPLDLWSRYLDGSTLASNGHALLSFGLLLESSGQYRDAIAILKLAAAADNDGSTPLIYVALSRCCEAIDEGAAESYLEQAAEANPTHCFPSGNDHLSLLQYAVTRRPAAASFHSYLGNLLFHHRRHEEAIEAWEESVRLNAENAQAWRNLGIAYFNVRCDKDAARRAFDLAVNASPTDARLFYERDQLHKRLAYPPSQRLEALLSRSHIVQQRDDLSVELATLLNQMERPTEALELLLARHFQPWEGGEGLVLAQYTTALLKLARAALEAGKNQQAIEYLSRAQQPPPNLGEAKHLLANDSNIQHWLGEAYAAAADLPLSRRSYERSARQSGDFKSMSVEAFSEMTFWSGLSLQRLGREQEATQLFQRLLQYSSELEQSPAEIDYFATSLPALLLFDDDLQGRSRIRAQTLRAAALQGLGRSAEARDICFQVLEADPNSSFALDLLQHANRTQLSPVSN